MEAVFVSLCVVLGALFLIVLRYVQNTLVGKRPPIFEDIPYIGGMLQFAKGPLPLFTEGYARFGEVFTVPVAHKRITLLVGPKVVEHFMRASDDEMSQKEVYGYSVPIFGIGVVYDVDVSVRNEQIKFFSEALKSSRLKSYVKDFVMEAENFFSTWDEEGIIDLKETFDKLITMTASRTLLGREVREQMFDQVADLLHDLDEGMKVITVFAPNLPIPEHIKRDKARVALGNIFRKIVDNRRANNIREEDMIQTFIDARYQNVNDGRELCADEITGLLIACLFAGQHTSTITASWTGLQMINDKKVRKDGKDFFSAACEEQREIMQEYGEQITYESLLRMEVLHRNTQEALRLNPPLIAILRYAREPFDVTDSKGKTFHIPKGDIVMVSPTFNHRLAHVFEKPDEYDPARFAAPRQEDKKVPFSFIGFGGGRHGCIGYNFAFLQIKAIWSVLLRNFDFQLLDPLPDPDYSSLVIGPKPCRVKYYRRKL
eukprot:TRINITY_DN4543_c2_g2_i4.p1 TRINITY_DN4543_c2_g2~~TRINITY_DN4543_c2_g2_i4.p1  ORF type:complete len:487 (-),score=100.37 TRINITY_DN4543_c2_g2_i4:612-2072(-)